MLVSSICGSNNKVHNVNVKISAGLDLKGGDAPQESLKISCILLGSILLTILFNSKSYFDFYF